MNSKKAKALVYGSILKREGIKLDALKEAFRSLMTPSELMRSLTSLEKEGRISHTVSADTYVPTELLDRIHQKRVRQAANEVEAESKGEFGIPSSLIEALKERHKSL